MPAQPTEYMLPYPSRDYEQSMIPPTEAAVPVYDQPEMSAHYNPLTMGAYDIVMKSLGSVLVLN